MSKTSITLQQIQIAVLSQLGQIVDKYDNGLSHASAICMFCPKRKTSIQNREKQWPGFITIFQYLQLVSLFSTVLSTKKFIFLPDPTV